MIPSRESVWLSIGLDFSAIYVFIISAAVCVIPLLFSCIFPRNTLHLFFFLPSFFVAFLVISLFSNLLHLCKCASLYDPPGMNIDEVYASPRCPTDVDRLRRRKTWIQLSIFPFHLLRVDHRYRRVFANDVHAHEHPLLTVQGAAFIGGFSWRTFDVTA